MRRVWQVRPMRQIQQRRRQQQMQKQLQQQQPKDKNNWGAAQGQGKLWGGAEVRRARGPEKHHAVGRVRGWRHSPAALTGRAPGRQSTPSPNCVTNLAKLGDEPRACRPRRLWRHRWPPGWSRTPMRHGRTPWPGHWLRPGPVAKRTFPLSLPMPFDRLHAWLQCIPTCRKFLAGRWRVLVGLRSTKFSRDFSADPIGSAVIDQKM